MNDPIDRQTAIDALHGYFDGMLETDTWSPCDVYGLIEILPSVQPDLSEYSDKLWRNAYERGKAEAQDEIVRCKDCKHSRFFDPCFYCYEFGKEIIVPENGFCFMAERRTDEHID